jgi:hypothetical protein
MKAIIAIIAVALLAFGSASGQEHPSARTPASREAPVGHRQPTTKDVEGAASVAGIGASPELEKADKNLDQKLHGGICRGC